jgi:membrane protein DedA with SNARE-associated domain
MFDDPTNYGYLGIVVFLILTGCGLPLPEEVAIIAAGVTAGRGTLNPWLALASCVVGAIVGDSAMYWIGRLFGKGILEHHPFWAKVFNAKREQQIEGLLKKHGAKMLLLVRFLPGLRSPVYFAAGVLRANYLRFLITDTICAVFVVSLFFGLTYYYGSQILAQIHDVEVLIVIGVVIALVIIGVLFWVHRRSKKLMESPANDEAIAVQPVEQSPAKQSPAEHVPAQNSDGHQPTEQHPPPVSVEKQ